MQIVMPNIKIKSEECLKAAQKLIDLEMYNSSIHCSYYSVFLYMKYILANTANRPVSYEAQKEQGKTESHKFVIREIRNRVAGEKQEKDIRQLFDYIKAERINADYTDKLFDANASLSVIDMSKGLFQKLNDQFGKL